MEVLSDIRQWIKPVAIPLHNITNPHCFVILKAASGVAVQELVTGGAVVTKQQFPRSYKVTLWSTLQNTVKKCNLQFSTLFHPIVWTSEYTAVTNILMPAKNKQLICCCFSFEILWQRIMLGHTECQTCYSSPWQIGFAKIGGWHSKVLEELKGLWRGRWARFFESRSCFCAPKEKPQTWPLYEVLAIKRRQQPVTSSKEPSTRSCDGTDVRLAESAGDQQPANPIAAVSRQPNVPDSVSILAPNLCPPSLPPSLQRSHERTELSWKRRQIQMDWILWWTDSVHKATAPKLGTRGN